ncbi:hypothetical protein GCM10010215_24800 [Streptomyces virginiae]|uniref:Transposase n=1 Tax=Streptomyces virginiae TaxID=1961 RepID=A0ABQ3NNJ8_STRVG|nr:hypothetical protein GCM10010215_24800 [Streptomyces virginiae]GHI14341.1 hypothetical protein Scinn_38040 [Streptomyces virginiae]GLV95951.1 hypothetical protein Slala04_74040 [Streptomyces lavendulae subsp. lavendulae]
MAVPAVLVRVVVGRQQDESQSERQQEQQKKCHEALVPNLLRPTRPTTRPRLRGPPGQPSRGVYS